MTQNAINFIKKVSADPSLKAKVLNLYQKKQKNEIEKTAKDLGFSCTYQDIEAEFKNLHLSDEELLKISGGGNKGAGQGPGPSGISGGPGPM